MGFGRSRFRRVSETFSRAGQVTQSALAKFSKNSTCLPDVLSCLSRDLKSVDALAPCFAMCVRLQKSPACWLLALLRLWNQTDAWQRPSFAFLYSCFSLWSVCCPLAFVSALNSQLIFSRQIFEIVLDEVDYMPFGLRSEKQFLADLRHKLVLKWRFDQFFGPKGSKISF